jgi:hypothetical protein
MRRKAGRPKGSKYPTAIVVYLDEQAGSMIEQMADKRECSLSEVIRGMVRKGLAQSAV